LHPLFYVGSEWVSFFMDEGNRKVLFVSI